MYKILIKTCTSSNNIWNFYQENEVDYVATSLEEMKPVALMLLKKYGKKNIKIIDQKSGQDMDNAALYLYGADNYEDLINRPFINKKEIIGNLSLEDLGVQPRGDYATNAVLLETENKMLQETDAKIQATEAMIQETDAKVEAIDLTPYATTEDVNLLIDSAIGGIETILATLTTPTGGE